MQQYGYPLDRHDDLLLCHRNDAHEPPCTPLLTTPSEVIADPSRRPRHICPSVEFTLRYRWASRQTDRILTSCPLSPDTWRYRLLFPLPVGRQALEDAADTEAHPALRQAAPLIAPFDGHELALIVVTLATERSTITAFGLTNGPPARSTFNWALPEGAAIQGARFLIDSPTPHDPDTTALVDGFSRFWATVAGHSLRGRPRETSDATRYAILECYYTHLYETGRRPTQETMVELLAAKGIYLGVRTFQRKLKALGIHWHALPSHR